MVSMVTDVARCQVTERGTGAGQRSPDARRSPATLESSAGTPTMDTGRIGSGRVGVA